MRDRPTSTQPGRAAGSPQASAPDRTARIGLIIVVLILATVVVIGADYVIGALTNSGNNTGPTASPASSLSTGAPAPTATQIGVTLQGQGGHWTNVSADQLGSMLTHKDFELLNVKTPYIGEIDGTDLYIPYDQLTRRTAELPADKSARLLVYCRSGVESAQAAQTLLNFGYTNVWNLDGGMNAWQSSGRKLVDKGRT